MAPLHCETRYDGPTLTTELAFAGHRVRLVRPGEPDRLLEESAVHALSASDDYMPYWAYLWPAAYLLAEAVASEPWAEGTEALEIGCGLGLAGLVGLAAGLRVRFTDYDATSLRFVERSIEASGLDRSRASTSLLDWRDPPRECYRVILGADVLYERRLVPLVVGVIRRMLAPGGLALLASPYRVSLEELEPRLRAEGLTWMSYPVESADEADQPVRGILYRVGFAS